MNLNIVYVSIPGYARHDEIVNFVTMRQGTHLNFYTMKLDELEFIARHRILPAPTILILRDGKVMGRLVKDLPDVERLTKIVDIMEKNLS